MERKLIFVLMLGIILLFVAKFYSSVINPNPIRFNREGLPVDVNTLQLKHKDAAQSTIVMKTNPPLELDGLAKEQILQIRTQYVLQHAHLVKNQYQPAPAIYNHVASNKPWWGLEGQFCFGDGEKSIEGMSEESRFMANPFHLLYLDEGQAFAIGERCWPVFPRPIKLIWSLEEPLAQAEYPMAEFFQDKESLSLPSWDTTFTLDRTNAIDFGYNFIYIDPNLSKGVIGTAESLIFDQACQMKGFFHLGSSCGFPGGCNNGSPYQPELFFKVVELPAKIYCRLWKKQPNAVTEPADFAFVINLY